MTEFVEIFEVGPRDGLQNEPKAIALADKVALVDLLSQAGFLHIEAASFVSPERVPQMAESAAVLAGIARVKGVSYTALTPNLQGFQAAIEANVDEVAVFASASEGFSQANINCSISESLGRFKPILDAARHADIPVRGYVSCVADCPYDGVTAPDQVAKVAAKLFGMGCYQISLGDTLGKADPETITAMLGAVLDVVPAHRLAGHYHDTSGRALVNIEASLALGLRAFDSSVAGLGGCPFAPGSAGNVASEAVNDLLIGLGYDTGLNGDMLAEAVELARGMRS